MKPLLLLLGMTAIGHALYHVGQKILPTQANPMVLLMGVYAVAFALAGLAAPFFRVADGPAWTTTVFSWPVVGLGFGVLLIELGFLLTYRTGGGLQWVGVAVSALSTLFLVPIALTVFRETFSLIKLAGILLTLGGLTLLTWKR